MGKLAWILEPFTPLSPSCLYTGTEAGTGRAAGGWPVMHALPVAHLAPGLALGMWSLYVCEENAVF